MKQFEKWYNKECKKETNPNVYYGAELGWKAALEWAYSLREPDHTDIFEEINPMWIKKELNGD